MTNNFINYYKLLQVDIEADTDVIEAAYKRVALKYHPDIHKTFDAEEKMKLVNEAKRVLTNSQDRCEYDRFLSRQAKNPNRKKKIEIIDLRGKFENWDTSKNPKEILNAIGIDGHFFVEEVWTNTSSGRYRLEKSNDLVIITSPPSKEVWRFILKRVEPKNIYLIGIAPPEITPQEFLGHLAGMVKYIVMKNAGKTKISVLSVGTAQCENTIRLGLEWLSTGGQVNIKIDNDNIFASLTTKKQEIYSKEKFIKVKTALEKTAHYREYFHTANIDDLIF